MPFDTRRFRGLCPVPSLHRIKAPCLSLSCSATPIIAHAQHTLQAVLLSKNGFSLKIIFSYRLLTFSFSVRAVPMFPCAYTLYIGTFSPRRACHVQRLLLKKTNRFPLCYYYIESIRFCQAFQRSFTFPNMTDCTNAKCSIHSKRPVCSKHSRQPSRQVFPPSSLYSSARKLTIGAYIAPAKS